MRARSTRLPRGARARRAGGAWRWSRQRRSACLLPGAAPGFTTPSLGNVPGEGLGPLFPQWAEFAKRQSPIPLPTPVPPMKNDEILSQITEFCRQADMAESTFGRRAVNDGKLVHRLREGKRITIDTLDRIQAYIAASGGAPPPRALEVAPERRDPRSNFRFFENRQKYLLFV